MPLQAKQYIYSRELFGTQISDPVICSCRFNSWILSALWWFNTRVTDCKFQLLFWDIPASPTCTRAPALIQVRGSLNLCMGSGQCDGIPLDRAFLFEFLTDTCDHMYDLLVLIKYHNNYTAF